MCDHKGECCFCGSRKGLTDVRRGPGVESGPSPDDIWDSYCPTYLCICCVIGSCEHSTA